MRRGARTAEFAPGKHGGSLHARKLLDPLQNLLCESPLWLDSPVLRSGERRLQGQDAFGYEAVRSRIHAPKALNHQAGAGEQDLAAE